MGKKELFEGLVATVGFFAACTIIGYIKENFFENPKGRGRQLGNGDDDDDGDLGDFPFTSPAATIAQHGGANAGLFYPGGGDDNDSLSEEQANMGVIETLVGTADMLFSQGRFEDAEEQYQRALELVKSAMGPSVPLVGHINRELGVIYRCMSRLAEADKHFGAAASIFAALYEEANMKINPEKNLNMKKILDDVTDDVMSSDESPLLLLLSYCLSYTRALSEQAEAKTLLTRSPAQIIGGAVDGEDSAGARPLSKDEIDDMLVEAHKLAETAVTVYAECFGRPPEDIKNKKVLAGYLRTLTQVEIFQKSWSDAEKNIRECLALLLESTYPKDLEVTTARMWLTQILVGSNRPEESIAVCKEMLQTHKGTTDEAYFVRYLGEIYADCDMNSDAEKSFGESLRLYDENIESEAYMESLSTKERKSLESGRWETLNSLASLYRAMGRVEEAGKIVGEMCENMRCESPPYTTSRYLRTLECAIKPYKGDENDKSGKSGRYVYGINILIRQRNEKKLKDGSFLVFFFEDPKSGEMVRMRIEKCVENGEKTVAMSSPDFEGMKGGRHYRVLVKVLASDHETVLSEHLQLVKCEPLTLSL